MLSLRQHVHGGLPRACEGPGRQGAKEKSRLFKAQGSAELGRGKLLLLPRHQLPGGLRNWAQRAGGQDAVMGSPRGRLPTQGGVGAHGNCRAL